MRLKPHCCETILYRTYEYAPKFLCIHMIWCSVHTLHALNVEVFNRGNPDASLKLSAYRRRDVLYEWWIVLIIRVVCNRVESIVLLHRSFVLRNVFRIFLGLQHFLWPRTRCWRWVHLRTRDIRRLSYEVRTAVLFYYEFPLSIIPVLRTVCIYTSTRYTVSMACFIGCVLFCSVRTAILVDQLQPVRSSRSTY